MKRYWKSILISLAIVVAIGSYYVQLAWASKNDVSFKIETISGNKEEIENRILQASYQSGNINRWLYISKDGSTNRMNSSFLGGLIVPHEPLLFKNFIQEHRNFMRGKVWYPSMYFEDEARLMYTIFQDKGQRMDQGNSWTLKIDILDKNTNDSSSFEINTPVFEGYDWINVNNVYVENGKIKILAYAGYLKGGNELHIYTVNENTRELEQDLMIAKIESGDIGMSNVHLFNDPNIIQNEKYYLYMVERYRDKTKGSKSEFISREIYLYNNLTNEVKEWIIPAELKSNLESTVLYGADIFIPVHSAKSLVLNRYNIEKKQWEKPLNFEYPNNANEKEEPFFQLTDGKLYLVNRTSDGHLLVISDVHTGESLYEGKIIVENRENLDTDYSLYIGEIYNTY
ncbi:hypothetical protein C3943_19160 [Lysinibacillus sp. B2A1]|nr:hypothetical protein C3943_19160 [Lysinibacillus sp. B2A1]